MHNDLVGMVERVLAETGLEPSRLDLEITEGLLIEDAAGALATCSGSRRSASGSRWTISAPAIRR